MTGVIIDADKAYKRKVSVNPVEHHYEEPDDEYPYIKYGCPVCEQVGNRASVPRGVKSCPLCGVSLNWDRKPEVGDYVLILYHYSHHGFNFKEGDRGVIVESNQEQLSYVIKCKGKTATFSINDFTILDNPNS